MGERELLTTTPMTSARGIVRRRRVAGVGLDEGSIDDAEKSIQTASATPPSLPKRVRLRSSSGPTILVCSSPLELTPVLTSVLPFVGVACSRARIRSYSADRREELGVCGVLIVDGVIGVDGRKTGGASGLLGVEKMDGDPAEDTEDGVMRR